MNKKTMRLLALFLILIMVLPFAACASNKQETSALQYQGNLKIVSANETIEIPFNDIYKMESVTRNVNSVTSSGEEVSNEVLGVLLSSVLSENGIKQEELNSIRLVAGDGYAIDVPTEIVTEKEIILAYEFDGNPLKEKKQPLRAAIDDVRSMYFVSNLTKIELNPIAEDNVDESISKAIILETEAKQIELHEYTYYENVDKAIKVTELFGKYKVKEDGSSEFVAEENFTKTEKNEVLGTGYFKITGENSPLFISPDLPKGMHVKNFLTLSSDDIVFVSAKQMINYLPTRQVNGVTGAKLEEVVDSIHMNSDYYTLTSLDGYKVEVTKDSLEHGIISVNDEGLYKVSFDSTMPKSASVKDIHTISVGTGEKAIAPTAESDKSNDTKSKENESALWTITFEGLEDGIFDFTSDKAERKLELVELDTQITKNDKEVSDSWNGYRVLDVLAFLKVTEFDSLVMTSNDGFEMEYTKDEIDDTTIFAVMKNDEMIKEDTLVRLVQDSQFASKWLKGICKVTVK